MNKLHLTNARIAGFALILALARAASAQDFTLTLQPNTLTLIPNEEVSLVVSMTPINGFTNPVSLTVGTLPSGVTAQFNPATVTLPGTSILSLRAATNAALGTFTLNVTGAGGGITNTTASSVTVNFGLVPICTGAFTGQVTDAGTGLPVSNAYVVVNNFYTTQTDTNGVYTITGVALGNNNSATLCDLDASASGYYVSAIATAYAVCDATNTVNLQIVLEEFGSLSGTVTIQGGGPATGVPVNLLGGKSTLTDSNGGYQFTNLALASDNAPNLYAVDSNPRGYWEAQSNAVVQANSNTVVDLVLVPICYGTVTGSVFYGDTLLPATNASASITDSQGYGDFANTDSNGNYTITNIALDENGTLPRTVLTASAGGYYQTNTFVAITNCGATATAPTVFLSPIPKDNYGNVTGHVYDSQTGLPLAEAQVDYEGIVAYTDTNGVYLCHNIFVGVGGETNSSIYGDASLTGYFAVASNTVIYASQTVTQDFRLLRVGYGYVMGTVRDSATDVPLTNVVVSINAAGANTVMPRTDTNGHYFSGPLPLGSSNGPTLTEISVTSPLGYYQFSTNTTITLGVTNVVDIPLLKVCTGATIIGNVVNALTQQPITNATLTDGSPFPAYTDTNGNFILTNITVGNDNSPIQVSVNVSAPGFIAQSKSVTIFCNATIIADFGAPQTAVAVIQGMVTNVVTGVPMPGVFIGSQFGESATTDSNGFYQLTEAPLGPNNSSRTWTVTAIPTNFLAQTLSVTVSSNAVSTLNFGFGEPSTGLILTATGAPNPVTVGGQLVYLVTLTNTVAQAQEVQLSDTLPPDVTFVSAVITNSPATPFSSPVFSNNVVTTAATDFDSNSAVSLAITVTATNAGTLTNVAVVTSSTPDIDPTGSNHTATVITTALAPAAPTALIVSLQATPANTVEVGSNLVYTLTLTNTIANATDVQLVDTLPASVNFVAASVSNSPGAFFVQPVFSNGAVSIGATNFASNSVVVLSITVTPTLAGTLTNAANVTTATTNLAPSSVLNASAITTAFAPAAPTALIVTLQATPANTVPVGSNLLYTLMLTNTIANAADVQLVDTLPPSVDFVSAVVSNFPGANFSAPVFSNGTVTIGATSFSSNSVVELFINVIPTVGGPLTNVVNVTSATTNLAPGTILSASATNAATANADLVLILTENSASVVLGGNISYTLLVTNLGPANAPDVALDDTPPANAGYVSSSTSQGAAAFSHGTVHWDFGALSNHGFATATLVVTPAFAGLVTNSATVTLVPEGVAVVDPNLANNTASIAATVTAPVVTNTPPPTNLAIQVIGPITFNPQTGLYQQSLLFTNQTGVALAAVRVTVLGLSSSVILYNATGSTNSEPYVEYDQTIAVGGTVTFMLEYYNASRQSFASTNFVVTTVVAETALAPNGTVLQLDRVAFMSEGQLTIEFASVPGHTYVVEYSSDMQTWQTATPPVVAQNTRTQWIDAGPPKTESPPGNAGQRFYRVVQTN